MTVKSSLAHRTAVASLMNTDIGANAVIKFLSGTRPATVDTALSGNTTLATFAGNAAGFGTATAGVLTAAAIASVTASAGSNTPCTFARVYKADGTTAVLDCDVAATGSDINIAGGPNITAGQQVSLSSFTYTPPGA